MKKRIIAAVALPIVGLAATAVPAVAGPTPAEPATDGAGQACIEEAGLCVRTNVPGTKVTKLPNNGNTRLVVGNDRLTATYVDAVDAGNMGDCERGKYGAWVQEAKATAYTKHGKAKGLDADQVFAVKAVVQNKDGWQAVVALSADPDAGRVGQKLDACDLGGVSMVLSPDKNRMVASSSAFPRAVPEDQARAELNAEQAEAAYAVLASAYNKL